MLYRFEEERWAQGFLHVAGVDEAGRGPLAGPVVAAAVILPRGHRIRGLNDSKRLKPGERERLYREIILKARAYKVSLREPGDIDRMNILRASLLAMQQAVEGLKISPDLLLVDGPHPLKVPTPQETLIGGDGRSASVAAASILSKVSRDCIMAKLEACYPGYGFASHKGYATREHLEALRRLGPSPAHRLTFRGVRELCGRLPFIP